MFLGNTGAFPTLCPGVSGHLNGADSQGEEWRWVQKQFEKLKIHKKRDNGLNIWICNVQGPRKKSTLKGYLIGESTFTFTIDTTKQPFPRG